MSVIPNLKKSHIEAALARIRVDGVPAHRVSKKFCLVVDGRHLPPKYVVGLATSVAHGREPRPDEFSGGPQSNEQLTKHGYTVVACPCGGTRSGPPALAPKPVPVRAPATTNHSAATVLRVVVRGRTPEDPSAEERLLLDVFGKLWPPGIRAKFVVTPGGFVHGTLPSKWGGRTGWDTAAADIRSLLDDAERQLARVVTPGVLRAAVGKAEVLTVGIDLFTDLREAHAELVAVYDVTKAAIVRWTGKSYPVENQARELVHVVDLDTHLLRIAGERVLVLGCHDLNMFSPRGYANQSPNGPRRARCKEMRAKTEHFRPTVVLQHPHSTDTPNIWRLPWLSLAKQVPSIHTWASGVGYYRGNGRPRAPLERVLAQTKSGDSVQDVVVRASDYERGGR